MKRWKTRTRVLLLLVIVAVAVMGYVLYTRYKADFPAVQATLIVQSGSTHVTHAAGTATDVTPADKPFAINAGDTLDSNGLATLSFSDDTANDLFPGTRIRLDQFGKSGSDSQISLSLFAGQTVGRAGSFEDRRAYYRLMLVSGGIAQLQNGQFIATITPDRALIGAMNGNVSFTTADTLIIPEGSGVVIDKGTTPAPAQPWSLVRVPLYRPDGSLLSLPITLANISGTFVLVSDRTLLMPPGNYSLTVDLLQPYTLSNIALAAGKLTELPVTLSELVFSVTDPDGKPLLSPTLIASVSTPSNHQANVQPNASVLISPGSTTLNIARSDTPDLWQSTGKLDVLPGQRLPIVVRNDLFGSGSLLITVTGTDGTPQTAKVSVYPDGSEEKLTATNNYKVEALPPAWPRGKYTAVVTVKNSIAGRYPVEVKTGEITALKVDMGTLAVSYTDSAGRAISQFVYIASEAEMARLNLPIEQMRNTPYGYSLMTGQTVTVPAGRYVVKISDARVTPQTVTVTGGQTAQVTVTAP